MIVDLERHDALVRTVVSEHGGSVFKHTGDGAMAAFDDPAAAVMAAVALQGAMALEVWSSPGGLSARVAVHVGSVSERGGDRFGTAVNKAARLVAVCTRGGVVVSSSVAAVLADRPAVSVSFRDLGEVELRGFARPERVYGVIAAGVAEPDAIRGGNTAREQARLPVLDDELVGRTEELEAIWHGLSAHSLVTVLGVGGMGKTRLALEAAAGLTESSPGDVWWCDLSAATTAEAVGPIVMGAVDARQAPGTTPIDAIVDRLSAMEGVVVLDNCEHVLEESAGLVRALRTGAPSIRVLATSREALGVRGESLVPLTSLPLQDAVKLFIARAGEIRNGFDPSPDDRDAIAKICAQLDGIPLAIELAAARCRSMSVREIEKRLTDRFRLLRSGRSGVERHRTLQSAVAWSYELLNDDERDLFDALAVFADGSLLDGIAAVSQREDLDALDLLDRLVARSLVVPVETALGTRYRQLETLRAFAEDRLAEKGTLGTTRDQHLGWLLAFMQSQRALMGTASYPDAFTRFVAELDNCRSAAAHAMTSHQEALAVDLVGSIGPFSVHRLSFELVDWVDAAQHGVRWSDSTVDAISTQALLRFLRGDVTALNEAALLLPEEATRTSHYALSVCAFDALWVRADFDLTRRLIDAFRPADAASAVAVQQHHVFLLIGELLAGIGDATTLENAARGAVAHAQTTGDPSLVAASLSGLAFTLANIGRPGEALGPARQSLEESEALGSHYLADVARGALARALGLLAGQSHDRGDVARQLRSTLTEMIERGSLTSALVVLDGVALLLVDSDPELAYLLARTYERGWMTNSLPHDRLLTVLTDDQRTELDLVVANTSWVQTAQRATAALDHIATSQRQTDPPSA